ncbi:hypothetical protein LINPERPRIM_LOCUS24110 [Linum perenne]
MSVLEECRLRVLLVAR